ALHRNQVPGHHTGSVAERDRRGAHPAPGGAPDVDDREASAKQHVRLVLVEVVAQPLRPRALSPATPAGTGRAMGSAVPVLWQFRQSHYNEKARWVLDWKRIRHVRHSLSPGFPV